MQKKGVGVNLPHFFRRRNRTTLFRGNVSLNDLAHEFFHTTPENINRKTARGAIKSKGAPEEDGPFGAITFENSLANMEKVFLKDFSTFNLGYISYDTFVKEPKKGVGVNFPHFYSLIFPDILNVSLPVAMTGRRVRNDTLGFSHEIGIISAF